jgi:hypothetical protein
MKATSLLTLLLLMLAPGLAQAQTPAWQTAAAVGGTGQSDVKATATDALGNVYVVGDFSGTISPGSTTLTSYPGMDVFVAKWNTSVQRFEWAVQIGGAGQEAAAGIALSGANLYVTGVYYGGFTSGSTVLPNASGNGEVFIAKLTDLGTTAAFGWAVRAGGDGTDSPMALAAAGSSVYLTGQFSSGTATFGPLSVTNTTPIVSGVHSNQMFVTRLTDTGAGASFAWARSADTTLPTALAVSGSSVYVAGTFYKSGASFDGLTVGNANPSGSVDVFVAKLQDTGTAGTFVWAQGAGGMEADVASALAVQGSSVYVAGSFGSPTMSFGGATISNTAAGVGSTDVFVTRLVDAGPSASFAWARAAGGSGSDYARALATRGNAVYVAGFFQGSTAVFGSTTLSSTSGSSTFVARLTDTGSAAAFAWAQQSTGPAPTQAMALALAGSMLYVGGSLSPLGAQFGSIALTTPTTTAAAYLAGLTDPIPTPATGATTFALTVYPNPAHGSAVLGLPAALGAARVMLLDARGKILRTQPAPAATTTLSLAGLPAGLYLLRVQAGAATATRRLMVQ